MGQQDDLNNHANQLNQNNPEYWRSRNTNQPEVEEDEQARMDREYFVPLPDDDI